MVARFEGIRPTALRGWRALALAYLSPLLRDPTASRSGRPSFRTLFSELMHAELVQIRVKTGVPSRKLLQALAAQRSPATGRRYGIRRVCRAFGISIARWYSDSSLTAPPRKRGVKVAIADKVLVSLIKREMARRRNRISVRELCRWVREKTSRPVSRKRVTDVVRSLSPANRPHREHRSGTSRSRK